MQRWQVASSQEAVRKKPHVDELHIRIEDRHDLRSALNLSHPGHVEALSSTIMQLASLPGWLWPISWLDLHLKP
jgi:hypothetical protein